MTTLYPTLKRQFAQTGLSSELPDMITATYSLHGRIYPYINPMHKPTMRLVIIRLDKCLGLTAEVANVERLAASGSVACVILRPK